MTPYYQDSAVTIYHGDCLEIMPSLTWDIILTDPPYGINHPCDFHSRGRGALAGCNDYPAVFGDGVSFDPTWILKHYSKPIILWGANHYADKLPSSSGWLVWDKERPDGLDQSTCELAWTNCIKGVRIFHFLWNGMMRDGERQENYHPTQKPVQLMKWVLGLKWIPEGIVCDPYMGSGPVVRASKDLGRKAIGIEIEERYCEIAARRLSQEVLPICESVRPADANFEQLVLGTRTVPPANS